LRLPRGNNGRTHSKRRANKKDLISGTESGILDIMTGDIITFGGVSGSLSGALDPDSKEADEHAKRYYGLVRSMKTDVANIAQNTNFTEEQIKNVKDHLFMTKHDLGSGALEYFEENYEIAQSWQRLVEGKSIEPHDIILLEHELLEREYMMKGFSQEVAHRKAEEKYNYAIHISKGV
jgi:hypothetical protein